MRICHVCLDYPPRRTRYGSGIVNDRLHAGQRAAGERLTIVTPGRPERTDTGSPGLVEVPVGLSLRHLLPTDRPAEMFATPAQVRRWNDDAVAWLRSRAPLDGHSPEVIHSDGWTTHVVAASLARRFRCPLVTTAHVIDRHYSALPDRTRRAEEAQFRTAEQRCVSESDRIVLPSATARDLLLHYFPEAYAKVRVVPHGLDWHSHAGPLADRAADGLVVAHYLGRISGERGWRPFLEAFVAAADIEPRLRLRVVGGGRRLDEAVAGYEGAAVRFLGPLPRAEVEAELSRGDLYCNPALVETFGVAELEAMGRGLCVVSNDGFGKHTHVEHLVSGIRVPLRSGGLDRDAWVTWLTRLAGNPTLRRRLAARAYVAARRRYPIERMVGALADVYREAIDDAR